MESPSSLVSVNIVINVVAYYFNGSPSTFKTNSCVNENYHQKVIILQFLNLLLERKIFSLFIFDEKLIFDNIFVRLLLLFIDVFLNLIE